MKVLIWIKNFFLHFIKRILQILTSIVVMFACSIIYVLTYEPGTENRVTIRKAKRIRFLTKLKLYVYKWLSPYWNFQKNSYLSCLYNRFHFLIDK
jgi:hypothetical protein